MNHTSREKTIIDPSRTVMISGGRAVPLILTTVLVRPGQTLKDLSFFLNFWYE
jgi:hypothetical protein